MCELVARSNVKPGRPISLHNDGTPREFPLGILINSLNTDYVFQCWHPENQRWSTMLPPAEGMAWKMPPGSKIRAIEAKDAPPPEPSMVEQVKALA